MLSIKELTARMAQPGQVSWIGVRPARRAEMLVLNDVWIAETGLEGDHKTTPGKRAVTLIQAEHLPVIHSLTGRAVTAELLRRNIVVQGFNLLSSRGKSLRFGQALLRVTGPCAPCSRMEEVLGHGGYNAMRGHGGVTAEVLAAGRVAVGSVVTLEDEATTVPRT